MASHSSQSSSFTEQEPDNRDSEYGEPENSLTTSQQGSKVSLHQPDGEASQANTQPSPATDQRDSSLLNETLSVINEHISTLHSGPSKNTKVNTRDEIADSSSDYSAHLGGNPYSSELDTDGDEPEVLTEEAVRTWSPKRVANYLRKIGVEPSHCDVFEEQEISGDVFLEIDQSTIFLKEFDFGTMGRRLKTWHKIKGVHDEIWNDSKPTYPFEGDDYSNERDRDVKKYDSANFLPRIPSLPGSTDGGRGSAVDRQYGITAPSSDPSLNHTSSQSPEVASGRSSLRKASFDREMTTLSDTTAYPRDRSATSASHYSGRLANSQHATPSRLDTHDSAGGYFSDAGTQHQPRRINKQSISYAGLTTPESAHGADFESLAGDTISGRTSQAVTNLETPKSSTNAARDSKMSGFNTFSSAFSHKKFRRAMGLRPSSAGQEKGKGHDKLTSFFPPRTSGDIPGRLSMGSKPSQDQGGNSAESSLTDTAPPDIPRRSVVPRTKSKKDTSAYKQGLKKSSPQEQIQDCDYYGWMKKRSSNLITSFQSRFFILQGRRLSYYYSENDAEEKGIIDISSHSVLPADDLFISLHASLAPTKATPSSKTRASHSTEATVEKPKLAKPFSKPFIFKLVPPKAGSPHAVQFTKPTVHYFQVDNAAQGRAWMGALLKATIDRDMNLPIRTTNRQATVSLRQAANLNNRPPTLGHPLPTPSIDDIDIDGVKDEKEVQVEIEPAAHDE